jgi:hypothetical protein
MKPVTLGAAGIALAFFAATATAADARATGAGASPTVPGRSAAWKGAQAGRWTGERPRRGHDRARRDRGREVAPLVWGGGYGEGLDVRPRGGFFDEGARTRSANGAVVYDYDRGYPYDFYREPRPRSGAGERETMLPESWRCSSERAVRVCRR